MARGGAAALLVAAVALAGCGGAGSGADGGDEHDAGADGGEPAALPRRAVAVTVRVPDGTPGPVWIDVLRFADYDTEARVRLAPAGAGRWTGAIDVERGALVRYVYDRWDGVEALPDAKDRREASGATTRIEDRLVVVDDALAALDDVIETWHDRRDLRAPLGDLTGVVRDAATGRPVVDADVTAGGLHTATDVDGRFRLEALAAGAQRVVVTRALGQHRPAQVTVEVPADGAAAVALDLVAAAPATVTLEVALPAATPDDVEVRLLGNVHQAGARPYGTFLARPDSLLAPVGDRSMPGRARFTLALHAGTYVDYAYTLGGDGPGREVRAARRSFVVDGDVTRADRVAAWVPPGAHLVRWRLTAPPESTAGAPIALEMGPSHWMAPAGPSTWTFVRAAYPGEQVGYRYVLGGDHAGVDVDGLRWFTMPDHDVVRADLVTRWAGTTGAPAVVAGRPIDVIVRAALPRATPTSATVRVIGDGPLAAGVALSPAPGQPALRAATITVGAATPLAYHYEDGAGGRSPTFTWTPRHAGQASDDAFASWSSAPGPAGGARPGYLTGVHLPDYGSPAFLALSPSTFERVRGRGAGWVALSSVWSYGRTQPLPVLEPRVRLAPSVATPRDDLRAQAALARAHGLAVLLAPQWNMEMTPDGMAGLLAPKSAAWWQAWLAEAERFWLWHAELAEELDAGALLLPGPVFHVFFPPDAFADAEQARAFDQRVRELIARVRTVFHGALVVSGGVRDFDFPGDADLVGFTTFDVGRPDLPADASADAWAAAYEARFVERVDPLHARWGRPLVAYQLGTGRDPRDPDPTGAAAQARELDGLLRAVEARPWIMGSFSWGYTMIDAAAAPGDGVRARPAEAVLARTHRAFAGE